MIRDVSMMDVGARGKHLADSVLTGAPLSDWELWACACHQLKQHGDDAQFHAALRCDELLAVGDLSGHCVWLAILERIDDLTARRSGETCH